MSWLMMEVGVWWRFYFSCSLEGEKGIFIQKRKKKKEYRELLFAAFGPIWGTMI